MESGTWTHPDGGKLAFKTKEYKMLLTSEDSHIIPRNIQCFAKWKATTGSQCTKGVVYLILGDGDFDGTVKFINNNGTVDEASVKMFDLATKGQYSAQFKLLEEKPAEAPTTPKKAKKKK